MGHVEACQALLDRGADLNVQDSGMFVPMDLAAAEGYEFTFDTRGHVNVDYSNGLETDSDRARSKTK